MFTDTHCHLYSEYFDNQDEIRDAALLNGINRVINNGCDQKSNAEILALLPKYDYMYGAIGIHPEQVHNYKMEDIAYVAEHLKDSKVVALGEIGLDYHYEKESRAEQIKLLETQLEIAEKENVPVVIHSREATDDVMTCLKKYKVRGVIHSFSGSLEEAQEYIKMGFLLGINGVITFKNSNIKDVFKKIDLEHIILETDAPYLTPHPNRGKRNEPKYVKDIAEFVANLKGVSLETLAEITNENIKRVFNI